MSREKSCQDCGWAIWKGRDGISLLGVPGACSFAPMPSWYFLNGAENSGDYHFYWNHCFTGFQVRQPVKQWFQ